MGGAGHNWKLAYVVGTYPLLTTTFIDREIDALQRLGVEPRLVSLRRPVGELSPDQRATMRDIRYVMPVSVFALATAHLGWIMRTPRRYFGVAWQLVTSSHPSVGARLKTLGHFGLGVGVADLLRTDPPDHIHAHFVDRATTVAMIVSRLLEVPYSATAHANDIYVRPIMLREKIAWARFVATCTAANANHLADLIGDHSGRIRCIHHGLRLEPASPGEEATANEETGPAVVLAVGQLKEKKGLIHLIDAMALLRDRGVDVRCRIVGDGPQHDILVEAIERGGLSDRVELLGALSGQLVLAEMRTASVFSLPCVVAADGDRDGIPNVILEAMAAGLPVVSTAVSGIPEVVVDYQNGRLVDPGDPVALADAIAGLLADPLLRERLGRGGRDTVEASFDVDRNVRLLLDEMMQEART